MKRVKLDDLNRALSKRTHEQTSHLKFVGVKDLSGFADVAFTPRAGLLVICGGTGVGKTALLDLIYVGLKPSEASVVLAKRPRIRGAAIELSVQTSDQSHDAKFQIQEELCGTTHKDFDPGVKLVDLIERTSLPQSYFAGQTIDVLKEGLTPISFEKNLLEAVSMICRKDYQAVSVYEVEGEADQIIPLFEISEGGSIYNNLTMATGEISVLSLAWILRSSLPNEMLLIEEPEAYLPPTGHAAMFGLIAQAAVKQKLSVVLTTHSPLIAANIPDENLISIRRDATESSVPSGKVSKARTLSMLGLKPRQSAVLFVEDNLAGTILNDIISQFEFNVACNIEIVNVGDGVGGVKNALENLPQHIESVKFVGVLDGDQENASRKWACRKNLLFLPFATSMEAELLDAVENDIKRFSRDVGRNKSSVQDAINASRGDDPHDRFQSIGEALGLSNSLPQRSFKSWMTKNRGSKALLSKFAKSLEKILGVKLPE